MYRISGKHNNSWVQSSLLDRCQAVVVEGSKSDFTCVDSGVPQGSDLGPALFLLYINNLPEGIASKFRMFANDTICHHPVKTVTDQVILQRDLDEHSHWEEKWSMSFQFHPQKCSVLSAMQLAEGANTTTSTATTLKVLTRSDTWTSPLRATSTTQRTRPARP